jgi:hypothetical protein
MRGILQASMALLIMMGGADAAGADICAASVHPENFDHQRLILEGVAAGLRRGDFTRRQQIHDFLTEEFCWLWQRVRVFPGVHDSAQW